MQQPAVEMIYSALTCVINEANNWHITVNYSHKQIQMLHCEWRTESLLET